VYGTPAEALKMQEWLDSAPDKVKQKLAELTAQSKAQLNDTMKRFQAQIKQAP
jgi:F0F1-type ATP synthase membrane subunit b/b'